jgi:hypothetical protein
MALSALKRGREAMRVRCQHRPSTGALDGRDDVAQVRFE